MKSKKVNLITVDDWDVFVQNEYGKPYSFQQQDGCKERGTYHFTVPSSFGAWDYPATEIPETLSAEEKGVPFKAWLERDPTKRIEGDDFSTRLWWYRNFYPDISAIIDDLSKRGKLADGDYLIDIDW
jgi:hypothetical protein